MIYTHTSMYHGQLPTTPNVQAQIESHCRNILVMAQASIDTPHVDCYTTVFPIFIAGFATTSPDMKIRAVQLIHILERMSAWGNASRSREVLVAVCEEQSRRASSGVPLPDVDWIALSKERGLELVNFGL